MIKYPNGKSNTTYTNSSLNSQSNRGMSLENDINQSNAFYLDRSIANIHKKPTPIQIVHVDYPKRSAAKITEAYFKVPSTTDYNGVYKAKAIDFEAKECASKTSFPFSSIHPHQIKHLQSVLECGAIAFVLIRFTAFDETYYVKASDIIEQYNNSSRKSLPYTWFKEHGYLIPYDYINPVHYLAIVDKEYFQEDS